MKRKKILVIKLGALGDFIQGLGLLRSIKKHHANDYVVLLTTKPFLELAKNSGYIDALIIDERPKFYQLNKWYRLIKKLNKENFSKVYDLQANDRTRLYRKLLWPKPEWVAANGEPPQGQAFYYHRQTILNSGITDAEIDTLDWMNGNLTTFDLTPPYVLIVPGCAPTRPDKRWSAVNYTNLCIQLVSQGYQPVLIGTSSEKMITDSIKLNCPDALNLNGRTGFQDLPALARGALAAIGNDTGPMHFFGATGCKTLVLFGNGSIPEKHKPLGHHVYSLQKENINDISVADVYDYFTALLLTQ